jgi:hypothetical protein
MLTVNNLPSPKNPTPLHGPALDGPSLDSSTIKTMIKEEQFSKPYTISSPQRVKFKLLWWQIDEIGHMQWFSANGDPHCREVTFACLGVLVRQRWEIHNITPEEALPPMGENGIKQFLAVLKIACRVALKGPVWDFEVDMIDWEGSNGF